MNMVNKGQASEWKIVLLRAGAGHAKTHLYGGEVQSVKVVFSTFSGLTLHF